MIPIYLLRRGLCEAYLAGAPAQFEAAEVRSVYLPEEPFGLGTNCHALWDLLRPLQGWKFIDGSPVCVQGEMRDFSGSSLLHLKYHFGLDIMSWARLGAHVTGVDFSNRAIDLASSLSREIGISANFLCCNIYDLPDHLGEKCDIVFTSQGVWGWLSGLDRWAEVISPSLKPGGTFYILEIHPFAVVFDTSAGSTELKA